MDTPLAHVASDGRTHALDEHLREVARRARVNAEAFDGGAHAEIAGLWHDLGKYACDFQEMIRAANGVDAHVERDEEVASKAKVDHSTAGAFHAARKDDVNGLPIAFAIAGHHAGLADFKPKLLERFTARGQARLDAALATKPPQEILERAVPVLPGRLGATSKQDVPQSRRSLELFTRMIFSALCDADFLDTEAFFDKGRTALRGGHTPLNELATRLAARVDRLTKLDTGVNRARAEIRAACLAAAHRPRGILTLTVPTGGGKTLAAMELALAHALHHGLRRVVVAIPFTSILEQNAAVYREAFALPDDDTSVLEHHSAFDPARETPGSRLAAENWDAPVIVTTNVQLLESLFARRTSTCRKLHNLARSVIILDEAQTLPRGMLAPTTDVLEALVRDYNCTVVLCTATQPALGRDVLLDCGFTGTSEVIADPRALAERLRRVDVDWSRVAAPTPWSSLANELASEADVLAIVHRRDDARDVCAAMDAVLGDTRTFHLSALMVPAHRTTVLSDIRVRKKRGEHVRVASTQLVEAGVDLDFPVVYRALAGIDSLTQAAGRCNREGKLEGRGELRVFRATTDPPKGILQSALAETESMLRQGPFDLFDPDVHARFFRGLYRAVGLNGHDERDIQKLRAELSFEQVAEKYRLIDDAWSAPLVVPWDARALRSIAALDRFGPSRARLRELHRVTVNVRRPDLERWLREGSVRAAGEGTAHVLIGTGAYDARFGLVPERVGTLAPMDSVV